MMLTRLTLRTTRSRALQGASRRWMATSESGAEAATPESNFSRYAGIAFFSVIVAGTAGLGTWQTQRYFWKVDLIEERKKQLKQNVVDLPNDVTAFSELNVPEYCQLRVNGQYKPNTTFYLYPRSAPAESTDSVATPKSGGYIYSLLERDNGSPVIINRGWLPRKLLDVHMASADKEESGDIAILGVLRHGETKNQFTPDNDISRRQFFYLNHDELADAMGVEESILPVILDAIADEDDLAPAALDHPLRKKLSSYLEFYMTPEKHAGYAATWYSFSVAAALMAYFRFRKVAPRAPIRKRRS
ncbi:hypothetical protein Poli38472_000579 [Pythium oligandrum]|uniref:SURF1-like protein n=1 Tax=Pythium oligandrum TaxID=41045 RepID=A0A8K1CE13_PYTOL|nr:hypothetical protein Poli38472_000579 [Pythium oligandrum]|eukprot:TMW60537.1 hypothetical protein Poli38472_000579 [Pythium oligandrum]